MDIGTILLFVFLAIVPPALIYGMMFGDEDKSHRGRDAMFKGDEHYPNSYYDKK